MGALFLISSLCDYFISTEVKYLEWNWYKASKNQGGISRVMNVITTSPFLSNFKIYDLGLKKSSEIVYWKQMKAFLLTTNLRFLFLSFLLSFVFCLYLWFAKAW